MNNSPAQTWPGNTGFQNAFVVEFSTPVDSASSECRFMPAANE